MYYIVYYTLLNYNIYSKPCGDMADVLLSLKHTVPTPQSSVDEQHQHHDQTYGLSANHNVSTLPTNYNSASTLPFTSQKVHLFENTVFDLDV